MVSIDLALYFRNKRFDVQEVVEVKAK